MWPEALSFGDAGFGDEILFQGAPLTVQLALASLAFGLLLGLLNASMGLSSVRAMLGVLGLTRTVRPGPNVSRPAVTCTTSWTPWSGRSSRRGSRRERTRTSPPRTRSVTR